MTSKPAASPNSAPPPDKPKRGGSAEVCAGCRHDLRGLPPRGRCPECGMEFATSLPGLAPGSLPPTTRYQKFQYDAGLGRRALMKSLIWCIAGVGIVAAWKGTEAEGGTGAATGFLVRYGISLIAALGIYFLSCLIKAVEFTGPMLRATLGVAGALAGALLTQHVTGSLLWFFMGVPWLIGFIVHVGLLSDLLDLDLTEAGLLGIFTLAARVMLKFAVFDPMFN